MGTEATDWLEEAQNLVKTWAETQKKIWESYFDLIRSVATPEPLAIELTNFYWNIYEKTFGGFLLSPSVGYTREFNNKLLKGFDSWINFYKASIGYQLVLVDVWVKAFEDLMRELVSSKEKDETLQNWRQFLQVWSSVFDRVFAQTFSSEDALQIRGEFLNAAMTYRLHQQQLMEVFLKMYDVPVRSEVDEIHRSIYELRKEIKSLKKTLDARVH